MRSRNNLLHSLWYIKTPYFKGSRSFKVTDVNKDKKLVTSARYDKQHVYAYLQLFSR